MIDLRDMAKMVPVSMDRGLVLGAEGKRNVRMEVNTGEPAQFWIAPYGEMDPEKHIFLGVVMGRESVLFPADGPIAVFADCDGPCLAWAAEIEQTWVDVVEASFTRPHKRNKMSAELTQVAQMLQNAMGHRMEQLEKDVRESVRRELAATPQPTKAETNGRQHTPPAAPDTESAAGAEGAGPALDGGDGSGGKPATAPAGKGKSKPDEKPAGE